MRTLPALCLAFFCAISSAHAAPINVGNLVWEDRDADGVQDGGEPGFAGVTVQLWNSAKNQLLDSSTTNASGIYSLTAPEPGSYRVRVLLPAGATSFSPKDAGANDQLDSDVNPSGMDFGFTEPYVFGAALVSINTIDTGVIFPRPIRIGNFVWDDIDRDGLQDAGEPGVEGIRVQLWNAARNDLIDSDTTDASGNYSLIAPGAGDYRVRVLLPAGDFSFSPKNQGGDTVDSDVNPIGTDFGFTDPYTYSAAVVSTTNVDAGLLGPQLFGDGFE